MPKSAKARGRPLSSTMARAEEELPYARAYRVFNADQIDGLPEAFHPDPCPLPDHPPAEPIPDMQAFFDAIDITTVFSGTEARYNPPIDKIFMPSIERFKNPLNFYGVWAHELAHATKGLRSQPVWQHGLFPRRDRRRTDILFLGTRAWVHSAYNRAERIVFVSLVARASLGQDGDFQTRGGCAEGL